MNSFMQNLYEMYQGTQGMRHQLLDILTDADLKFSPGGSNPTLGALFQELADVERSYIDSITTLKQDWSTFKSTFSPDTTVEKLRGVFKAQEAEFKSKVEALTEAQLDATVDRGFQGPLRMQLEIYFQALLIAYGKLAVYVRAMNKELPKQWVEWIG